MNNIFFLVIGIYVFMASSIHSLEEVEKLQKQSFNWQSQIGRYEDDHVVFYTEKGWSNYYYGKRKKDSSYIAFFPSDNQDSFFKVSKNKEKKTKKYIPYITQQIYLNGKREPYSSSSFIDFARLEFDEKDKTWHSVNNNLL